MNATLEHWKSELSGLPASARAELAQYLLDSLETDSESTKEEWLALAKQRMAQVRAGRVKGIPADEVLKSLPETRP